MYDGLKKKHISDTLFLPELSYIGGASLNEIDYEYLLLDEILSLDYFKSLDLCYDELAQSTKSCADYKKIFAKAKKAGLKLKAHVGEYGTANDVMRVAETLELDEIHHGIGAASSPQVMKWLAKHKIQLNICPTSNVMLGRVSGYKEHPIRKLYDHGVPVTVNSDDMLIFNQSVSQEYKNLFGCGLMTANELNNIRELGLSR
jgi:adenosine deaminase